jgi:sigma-B regulation protein RsbU (phosphoserine phosphatase)
MTADDHFVTAFYGVLDSRNRVLTFTNGGHNPPLLMRADGDILRLREGGPLMGVLLNATYQERPIWLMPGDLVLLYTDGVTEVHRSDGEEFGEQRLIDLVQAHRSDSAYDLCHRIHDAVEHFAGVRTKIDDVTMVIIKVNPE